MSLIVGDTYKTRDTDFLRNRGIPTGVDYLVTNVEGNKVSLFLKYAHGRQSPQKLTVAKSYFSGNFEQDAWAPVQASYAEPAHYFPAVNDVSVPIWPSPQNPGLR